MIDRTKPNFSKASETDLMELLNINVYGHTNVNKIKIITEALYKDKGLIAQWEKGNKTAGVKARKVFQLIREISKEARADISNENHRRHQTNKEKYKKRQELKKEIESYDN
jgi:hypothetical protein